jgi:hypothetical protein
MNPASEEEKHEIFEAFSLTMLLWLQEEANEGFQAFVDGDKTMVIDAVFDTLGVCLAYLHSIDPADAVAGHDEYVKAQVDRDRQVDGIYHHDIIKDAIGRLSSVTDEQRASSATIMISKLKKLALAGDTATDIMDDVKYTSGLNH